MKWRCQIITCGCITIKLYCTCPSKMKRKVKYDCSYQHWIYRLTLVLSCAMKFESYPHDIQVCSMMIESLSHTVHDLVFIWNMTDPLVVNDEIELPQLDISNNYTMDCTIPYSTGKSFLFNAVYKLTSFVIWSMQEISHASPLCSTLSEDLAITCSTLTSHPRWSLSCLGFHFGLNLKQFRRESRWVSWRLFDLVFHFNCLF